MTNGVVPGQGRGCDAGAAGALMDCPFCAEVVKDEAIVCKHCGRDLRIVAPLLFKVQELTSELDVLQRQLERVDTRLAMLEAPIRFIMLHAIAYVLVPSAFLLAAHYLITIAFDFSVLYLRLASVIIPLPFGILAYVVSKLGFRGAFVLGAATAALSVFGMLAVVGVNRRRADSARWLARMARNAGIRFEHRARLRQRQHPRDDLLRGAALDDVRQRPAQSGGLPDRAAARRAMSAPRPCGGVPAASST